MTFTRKIIPAEIGGQTIHFREPSLAELKRIDAKPESEKLTAIIILAVCQPDGSPTYASAEAVEEIPVTLLTEIATQFQSVVRGEKKA